MTSSGNLYERDIQTAYRKKKLEMRTYLVRLIKIKRIPILLLEDYKHKGKRKLVHQT